MKRKLPYLFAAFAGLLWYGSASAQTYQPLTVTGFNQDVIANGVGTASGSTTSSVDNSVSGGANFAFHSLDYQLSETSTALTYGLPANGQLTSPNLTGLTFNLQPYTGNNSLRLPNQNDSGTLTLTTPVQLSALYLAATSGDGSSVASIQVNFSDGTNQTLTGVALTNWDDAAPAATPAIITNIGRTKRTTGVSSTGNFKLFQVTVPIDIANQSKLVSSVTVTKTDAGTESKIPNIFAVSGKLLAECPSIASSTGSALTSTSGIVNWTLGSYGTGGTTATYTVEVFTDAEYTAAVAGSPFNNVTATSQTIPGLTFGTTYYYRVKANNGTCDSDYSTGSFTLAYCVPTSQYTSTSYSLTNFATTGGFMNISNGTSAASGYNDYTTMMVAKAAGTSFDYSITRTSAYATVAIWVDWNQDLDFTDEGEQIASYTGAYNQPLTITGSINIPATAANGNYRIRVRSCYYYNSTIATCGQLSYGETEDYTLGVGTQPADCVAPATPVFTLGTITASSMTPVITTPETDVTGYLLVRSTAATLTETPVSGTSYVPGADFGGGKVAAFGADLSTFSDFLPANTHYYYFLFAYNNGGLTCYGPIYSASATADASTCALATVVSGASNIGNNSANLNYSSVLGTGGNPATYTIEVYTDAAMTAPVTGSPFTATTNSYTATGLAINTTYYYRVKATTTGCFDDAWSSVANFTTQSPYTPLDVTGFNADVIANGNGIAALSTTNDVDGVGNAYIALNYKNSAAGSVTTVGLPVNRVLNSSAISGLGFIMQDYSMNNSLRLTATATNGTLTLTQPRRLSDLYFAVTSGSGTSNISAVVTFQDGTTQAASTYTLQDWYGAATTAQPSLVTGIGRANRNNTTGNVETGQSKVFYVSLHITDENQTKQVASIAITNTSTGGTVPNIFAVSGKVIDECPLLNTAFTTPTIDGANVTFGLVAGSSAATSYSYSVYTDAEMTEEVEGSPFTTTTTTLTVTGLDASTTYYYSANALNSVCTSAPVTGSFTTSCNAPAAPTAEAQTACSGNTLADLDITTIEGATVKWYASPTSSVVLANTTVATATTYYVTQTVNNCESTRTAVAVTLTTTPAPTAAAQAFCEGATVADLTATLAEGATATWYATQGGEALEATAELEANTYYVTQTLNGCESAAIAVIITVNPAPAAPTAEALAFCGSATAAELTATGAEGATLTWYATEGGEALEATAELATGTYYVTQTVGTCTSEAAEVSVTVNPVPDAPVIASQSFCTGATVAEINVDATEGATITWYATEGGEAIETTTELVTGAYYATQTVGGCTSTVATVAVTVNTIPFAPVAEPQTVCEGTTAGELEVSGVEGAAFVWYDADNNVVAADAVLTSGTYTVTQLVASCESDAATVVVTVNETPDAPQAEAAQTFETGDTIADLDVTFEEGTTVAWYVLDEDVYVAVETTTVLEDGVTYYVNQSTATCTSGYTAITANIAAGTEGFDVRALTVYPNPASEVVNVNANQAITRLVVSNLLGQTVIDQNANAQQAQVNVSALAEGTYILQVYSGSKSATVKIVKQ